MKKNLIMMLSLTILFAVQSFGEYSAKDSNDFDYKYEGGSSFGPTFTEGGSGGTLSSDGDILTYYFPAGNRYFMANDWGSDVANTGYTFEVSLKMDPLTVSYGFLFFGTTTDICDDVRFFVATTGIVRVPGEGSPVTVYLGDMTSDFHTIRVAHEGDHGGDPFPVKYSMWVDGVLISDAIDVTGSGTYNQMYWGGGTGDVDGGAAVDYVRWTRGAFTPMPSDCTNALAMGFELRGDINNDCYVDLSDFAVMAAQWLDCMDPTDDSCYLRK